MHGLLGLSELAIVLLIVLLIVGPKRLPRLRESVFRSIHSFQSAPLERLYEHPVDVCLDCQLEKGLRCRSCGRFTSRAGYFVLALLVALTVALAVWHYLVPIL